MITEILTAGLVCVDSIDRLSLFLFKSDEEGEDEDDKDDDEDDSEEETATNIVMVSFRIQKRGIFLCLDKILGRAHSKRRKPVLENCVCDAAKPVSVRAQF